MVSSDEMLHHQETRVVELDIEGMTCASCVNRVEKKLGKLERVEATVNLPLESAHVTAPVGITDQQLVDTVNATGYKARVRQTPKHHGHRAHTRVSTSSTTGSAEPAEPTRVSLPSPTLTRPAEHHEHHQVSTSSTTGPGGEASHELAEHVSRSERTDHAAGGVALGDHHTAHTTGTDLHTEHTPVSTSSSTVGHENHMHHR